MSRIAIRSSLTHAAGAILALALFVCAGCSNDDGPVTFNPARDPRPLSESEVAEIKKTARSPQEFRKMVRTNMLADETVIAPKKSQVKRPTTKAR